MKEWIILIGFAGMVYSLGWLAYQTRKLALSK
jgi:hypothetical protein